MNLLEAVFLGLVQGLTEFLPVSSSGHLVLFGALLGTKEPTLVFEILLHFGTLLAVFVVFWPDIIDLLKAAYKLLSRPHQYKQLMNEDANVRVLLGIVIGTIPVVIVGFLCKDLISQLFNTPVVAGLMLIVTGTILYISDKAHIGKKPLEVIKPKDGLIIGLGQAVAVLPGISRSGTTIAVGLLRGIQRESAARFSFLLSIPAVLGSQILALNEVFVTQTVTTPFWIMAVGTLVSGVTGYFAIKLLLNILRRRNLVIFSYYTWFVGLLVVFLSLK